MLLVHHSLSHVAWNDLDQGAADAIDVFCNNHGVHFVLTSHEHAPYVPPKAQPHALGTELRCGTTLQGSRSGFAPSRWGNTFLLHRIEVDQGAVWWQTDTYERKLGTSFHPDPKKTYRVQL